MQKPNHKDSKEIYEIYHPLNKNDNINKNIFYKINNLFFCKILNLILFLLLFIFIILFSLVFTEKIKKPQSNESFIFQNIIPYANNTILYASDNNICLGNNTWSLGECKTNFPNNWSVGLVYQNKYVFFKFYNDQQCNSEIKNKLIMLSSGCVSKFQMEKRINNNYLSIKLCLNENNC